MLNQLKQLSNFFATGATQAYTFRYQQLVNLKHALNKHQTDLIQALKVDLNKPEFEAYSSEIGLIYEEISYAQKYLKTWMKPQKVRTPLTAFYAKSYIYNVPLGVVLIIAPWNYPVQLLLSPLVGAIAAGNCVIVKPSELLPNVTNIIQQIIDAAFSKNYVLLIEGDGATVVPELINSFKFNYVFFTGSTNVGKAIALQCAAQLIPYTLELGGKSPAIVDKTANLDITAKRIVWAKFFNAGQTCVAPDYLLVDYTIKAPLIEKLKHYIAKFYTNSEEDLAKIVNHQHLTTLSAYLTSNKIIYGGEFDSKTLVFNPTLVDEPHLTDPIMQREIFGPILPIISYQTKEKLYQIIKHNPNPLALYVFSQDQSFNNEIIQNISFGGGGINTGLMHLTNPRLPFGGVMESGQGNYHGKYSFDTFSHKKSIVKMANWIDVFIKYPPYTKLKRWLSNLFI